MFEFFLSIRVSFWLVGAGCMSWRCAATLLFFVEKHPHAQLPFLFSWRRRCGGSVRSDRYNSWLIGVKGVVWRNIPKDSTGLIVSIKRIVIRGCVRCLPTVKGAQIQWGRRTWRQDGWLRWLGAVFFIRLDHGHSSRHIEWVAWQVEIIEAEWHNWMLTAKPMWNYGFIGVRIDCDDLWLQRGDGGASNCFPFHCPW